MYAVDADYDNRPPFDQRLARSARGMAKRRGQLLLRLLFGALGYCARSRPAGPAAGDAVRRILVVRVDLLGDVVLSLPAIALLRRAYPEAEIDMLVQKSTAAILEGQPGISRVLAYDPHIWRRPQTYLRPADWNQAMRLWRSLQRARYDLAISISGDMGSIITRLSGARRRFGYAKEAYPFFLTDPLPGGRYLTRRHETGYVLALAEAAAGRAALASDTAPRLVVGGAASSWAAALLDRSRTTLSRQGPVVALHGGARNGQAKRWPTSHFAALADRLIALQDALVVLTGAAGEADLAEAIAHQCHYPLLDMVGKTSLPELAALLSASDLVISGDSGPMHVAGAVGTKVIALHGPTDPRLSGPTTEGAVVLRRDLWCSPCYDASATAECPFGNPVCMKAITVELVYGAACRQLASTPSVRHQGYIPVNSVSKGNH